MSSSSVQRRKGASSSSGQYANSTYGNGISSSSRGHSAMIQDDGERTARPSHQRRNSGDDRSKGANKLTYPNSQLSVNTTEQKIPQQRPKSLEASTVEPSKQDDGMWKSASSQTTHKSTKDNQVKANDPTSSQITPRRPRRSEAADADATTSKTSAPRQETTTSPQSTRSTRLLLRRPSCLPPTPAAPVLDTYEVVSKRDGGGSDTLDFPITQSPTHMFHADEARQPTSRPYMRSLGSSSSLAFEQISKQHAQSGRFAMSRSDSRSSLHSLQRHDSARSLHDTELRQTSHSSSREQLSHLLHMTPFQARDRSARPVNTNSQAGPTRASAGSTGGARMTDTMASMLQTSRVAERARPPIVSKFAGYQQQFDPAASARHGSRGITHTEDMPGRIVSVDVPAASAFSSGFVDRVKASMKNKDAHENDDSTASSPPQYRYLMDYGLSGPPIDKAALSHVELTPRLESGLALDPTPRKSAATDSDKERGTASARAKLVVPDSVTTLGPNMIPFHFIHALTSATENALALDQAEVPVMASLLPGVADHDVDGPAGSTPLDASVGSDATEEHVHYIDTQPMRAIAYTAQAVSIQRIHTVTRRFADPFREALARVVDASGYMVYLREQKQANALTARADSGRGGARISPSGSRWNLGSYVSTAERAGSDGTRTPSHGAASSTRTTTALSSLGSLSGMHTPT